MLLAVYFEQVPGDRVVVVMRAEVHHVFRPPARDRAEHFLRKCPVRIDHANTTAGVNILVDEVEEKGALPHAGFANDIGMVPSVVHGEEEGVLPSIVMAYSEIDNVIIPHTQANRHSERVEVPSHFQSIVS